jgi:hypothetical protein
MTLYLMKDLELETDNKLTTNNCHFIDFSIKFLKKFDVKIYIGDSIEKIKELLKLIKLSTTIISIDSEGHTKNNALLIQLSFKQNNKYYTFILKYDCPYCKKEINQFLLQEHIFICYFDRSSELKHINCLYKKKKNYIDIQELYTTFLKKHINFEGKKIGLKKLFEYLYITPYKLNKEGYYLNIDVKEKLDSSFYQLSNFNIKNLNKEYTIYCVIDPLFTLTLYMYFLANKQIFY